MESQERVQRFIDDRLDELLDATHFVHGIWCGMLQWQLEGIGLAMQPASRRSGAISRPSRWRTVASHGSSSQVRRETQLAPNAWA